jgi:hypothetical protein
MTMILVIVCVAVLVFGVLALARRGKQPSEPPQPDEFQWLTQWREREARVEQLITSIFEDLCQLPVVTETGAGGTPVSRPDLRKDLENFVLAALQTELATSTRMVRTVRAPDRLTVIVKARAIRTVTTAYVREFMRTGDETWMRRTHQMEDFEGAP